ncbi:BESS domain-containing protein [Trichonephila inaurata madagascariensis]|uniref:BESS domain-containing protein n=1 Tax=Trichonephila inaurata madagascariensis TaxID=2747483 RepID=A0A8X6I444_9ARAC|nr:BESS domain-containing protein [Trichonephila inaurata madagascariensis]
MRSAKGVAASFDSKKCYNGKYWSYFLKTGHSQSLTWEQRNRQPKVEDGPILNERLIVTLASQCKDMWRKLRNCYLNAINRRQNKNIPKWKYEDEMSFLLPFIDVRSSDNDIEIHSQSPSINTITGSYHEANIDNSMLSEREDSSEMILPETSSFIPKKEPDDENMDIMSLARRRNGYRMFKQYEQARPVHDETEMFFLSISETVKRLPAVDQARIKMEVCKLVYESEIRQLEAEYEETL